MRDSPGQGLCSSGPDGLSSTTDRHMQGHVFQRSLSLGNHQEKIKSLEHFPLSLCVHCFVQGMRWDPWPYFTAPSQVPWEKQGGLSVSSPCHTPPGAEHSHQNTLEVHHGICTSDKICPVDIQRKSGKGEEVVGTLVVPA